MFKIPNHANSRFKKRAFPLFGGEGHVSPRLFLDYAGQTFWDAAAVKTFLEAHTFARDGAGTYKDAAGDIQVMGYNLFTYSGAFDNVAWSDSNLTVSAAAITYAGEAVYELVESVGSATRSMVQSKTTTEVPYVFSVTFKANTRAWGWLRISNTVASLRYAWFDLSLGVVGNVYSGLTSAIVDKGDGWYECTISIPAAYDGVNSLGFGIADADNVLTYTGDGSSAYAARAQITQSADLQEYSKTEAVANSGPRFNHEATNHTNLCKTGYLTGLDDGTNTTVTYMPDEVGPEGFEDSPVYRVEMTAASSTYLAFAESLPAGERAVSAYIKSYGVDTGFALYGTNSGGNADTLTATDSWARYAETFDAVGTTTLGLNNGDDSYAVDVLVCLPQVEAGSIATAYIPTGINLVTQSENMTDSDWVKTAGVTITANEADPNGEASAFKYVNTGGTLESTYQGISSTSGRAYSLGVWLKGVAGAFSALEGKLTIYGDVPAAITTDVSSDLNSGEWFYAEVTATADANGTIYAQIRTDINSTIHVWQPQMNAGDVVLEYVPTRAATAAARTKFLAIEAKGLMSEEERINLIEYAECNDGVGWVDEGSPISTSTNLTGSILGQFIGVSVSSSVAGNARLETDTAVSVVSGTTYSWRFLYQAGTSGEILIRLREDGGNASNMDGVIGALANNAQTAGVTAVLSETLQADGITWEAKGTWVPNFTGDALVGIGPNTGTDGETIIAVAAQLEEGGKPSSLILSEGAAKTRPEDVCSRDIEKTDRTNLALYSTPGDLGTTWTDANGSPVANYATAPDGTLTAVRHIDEDTSGSGSVYLNQNITISSAVDMVFSVYLKADQLDWANITSTQFDAGGNGGTYFDLTNGVLGTQASEHSSAGIESVGDGWYRCWFVHQSTTDVSGAYRIYLADSDGDSSVSKDGTSSILVWGVQLEVGSAPTEYIATGVNLLTYSEEFDDGDWVKSNTTITADQAFAPDGALTADHIQHSLTSGSPDASQAVTVVSGATMTFSIYVKPSVVGIFRLLVNNSSNHFGGWFDPATGLWGTTSDGGTATLDAVAVEALSNGWYRISVTGDIPSITEYSIRCYLVAADGSTTRSLTAEMFIWGAACNVGSDLLSYHITEATASAARTVSEWPWWNPIGGVFVVEWDNDSAIDAEAYAFHAHDGASNNALQIYRNTGTDKVRVFSIDGGVTGGVNSTVDFSGQHRAVVAIANGVLTRFTVDGEATITHTKSCGTDAINTLAIAMNEDSIRQVGGALGLVAYYPDPNMTDADMEALASR